MVHAFTRFCEDKDTAISPTISLWKLANLNNWMQQVLSYYWMQQLLSSTQQGALQADLTRGGQLPRAVVTPRQNQPQASSKPVTVVGVAQQQEKLF